MWSEFVYTYYYISYMYVGIVYKNFRTFRLLPMLYASVGGSGYSCPRHCWYMGVYGAQIYEK